MKSDLRLASSLVECGCLSWGALLEEDKFLQSTLYTINVSMKFDLRLASSLVECDWGSILGRDVSVLGCCFIRGWRELWSSSSIVPYINVSMKSDFKVNNQVGSVTWLTFELCKMAALHFRRRPTWKHIGPDAADGVYVLRPRLDQLEAASPAAKGRQRLVLLIQDLLLGLPEEFLQGLDKCLVLLRVVLFEMDLKCFTQSGLGPVPQVYYSCIHSFITPPPISIKLWNSFRIVFASKSRYLILNVIQS
jgi:hypothetical protein